MYKFTVFFIFVCSIQHNFAQCSPITKSFSAPSEQKCAPSEHWVRAHNRNAYTRSSGVYVSASNVSAHCHTNPPSYAVWNTRLKSGLPPKWENKSEKTKPWTEEEKDRVLDALSALPPDLLAFPIEGIYRLQRSIDHELNPAASHNDQIVLYDTAFLKNQNLARVIAHEFAHRVYRQIYDANRWLPYALVAQWKAVKNPSSGKIKFLPGRLDWVEEDGNISIDEDFSNNIEYFLFNPKMLNKKNPKIYEWIKDKYGDKFILREGS